MRNSLACFKIISRTEEVMTSVILPPVHHRETEGCLVSACVVRNSETRGCLSTPQPSKFATVIVLVILTSFKSARYCINRASASSVIVVPIFRISNCGTLLPNDPKSCSESCSTVCPLNQISSTVSRLRQAQTEVLLKGVFLFVISNGACRD